MKGAELIPAEFFSFLRFSAITGFLATTTLFINMHHEAFGRMFKQRASNYWWLFVLLSIVPFLLFLYIFNFVFGKLQLFD